VAPVAQQARPGYPVAPQPIAPQVATPPPNSPNPVAIQATEVASAGHANVQQALTGFLVSFQEQPSGQHWVLHEGDNLVGRADTKVVCAVPVAHGTTSTRHAMLRCQNGQMTLADLGSTNGTYRNNTKLSPESAIALNDGDEIRFGGFTVRLMMAKR
jgi:pSer/pThr/pTyr-binding forkhead associated (FHA) protein